MHTNDGDLRGLDRITVVRSVELVRQANVTDLDRPTPCAGWSLGDLVDHMTAQHRGFAAAAAGLGAELASWAVRPAGADAVEHYSAAADQVLAAFAGLENLDVEMAIPELSTTRTFKARRAVGFHLVDYLGHAWDVAQTLGLALDLPDEVIAAALPIMRAVPDGPERRAPGAIFGPVQPITRDDPLHEFLALIGRIG
jgi:uncharacterized protein (TIGR03086 family)